MIMLVSFMGIICGKAIQHYSVFRIGLEDCSCIKGINVEGGDAMQNGTGSIETPYKLQ